MVSRPADMVKPTSLLLKSLRVSGSVAVSKLLTGSGSWPMLVSKPYPEMILEE